MSQATAPVRLVLVTGAGRSGTSTVAGVLKRLGLHIPQPEIPADETNPLGFYEPQWVVDFHKSLLDAIPVRTMDSRPGASVLTAEAARAPRFEAALREWLSAQLGQAQLVIKDPRAFWVHELWRNVASELGIELSFLTMLRHPAEVARSRDRAYLTEQTDEFRRKRETAHVAAWCNAIFETEHVSRATKRAFVRYTDLVIDWRSAMARAGDQLGIAYNADLTNGQHEVDRFIDAGLYRTHVGWEDTDVPEALQAEADRTWMAVNELVGSPYDQVAVSALTDLREQYALMYNFAEAIALDHTNVQVALVRRNVRRKLLRQHEQELSELRRRLADAEAERLQLKAQLADLRRADPPQTRSLRSRVARRLRSLRS